MLWNSCGFLKTSSPKKKQSILMVFFVISMCDMVDICHAVVIALCFVCLYIEVSCGFNFSIDASSMNFHSLLFFHIIHFQPFDIGNIIIPIYSYSFLLSYGEKIEKV